ncbi:MAG: response regulator [Defluviitaleaceae bacterium]|nr:response regulator [Defluviitaleaceae bacterium]
MKKPIIAAVDDQQFICDMVETILGKEYEVRAFTKGEELVKFISETPTDLLLLDYDMPNMTGYEVLLAARATKNFGRKPVIFLTAELNDRMKDEMLGRGASDYLTKPLNAAELRDCVKKYLT